MRDEISMLVLIAAGRGDKNMIEYLLSFHGDIININAQNKDGRTPLHQAISYGRADCIELLLNRRDVDETIRDQEGKKASEMRVIRGKLNPSTETKIKGVALLSNQKLVRWNRSKIMLVGQGRAGKTALANNLAGIWIDETASTIGAEMNMKVLYGGVKGGRLLEYNRPKQELEALLAEQLQSKAYLQHTSSSPLPVEGTFGRANEMLHQRDFIRTANEEQSHPSISVDSLRKDSAQPLAERDTSHKKEDSFIPTLKHHDIDFDEVYLHYRKLQEIDTTSSYKLVLIDFGGQTLFNILHGFFMSRYGIYLLVFDMELFLSEEESKKESCCKELKFWLNSITMHTTGNTTGKAAPVAIVGTRGDKISQNEDHKKISVELEKMFRKMMVWQSLIWYEGANDRLCFFPNNNTLTKNNIVSEQLLRRIEENLAAADYMKREIPILWIKILDEMKAVDRGYLSYGEVMSIARKKYTNSQANAMSKEIEDDVGRVETMKREVREMLRFLNDMSMLMWTSASMSPRKTILTGREMR